MVYVVKSLKSKEKEINFLVLVILATMIVIKHSCGKHINLIHLLSIFKFNEFLTWSNRIIEAKFYMNVVFLFLYCEFRCAHRYIHAYAHIRYINVCMYVWYKKIIYKQT